MPKPGGISSPLAKDAICLVLLLTLYFGLESLLPLRTAVQIGGDEGFELAKATLCLKGYKLYSEVWNDQPPLHTAIITTMLELKLRFQSANSKISAETSNDKGQNPNSQTQHSALGPRLLTVGFSAV